MEQSILSLNDLNQHRGVAGSVKMDCVGPSLTGNCILHHVGLVVPSISAGADELVVSLSARWDGEIFHDPIQRVRVAFFSPADTRKPVFELVEPAGEASPVTAFLRKRGGFHHVCYEIDDLDSGMRESRRAGLVVVAAPAPAVAFGGRRIAWVQVRQWKNDAEIREAFGIRQQHLPPLPMFAEIDGNKGRLLVELLERNRK
jgi:methylmalonyl-CoA/ethylmalonyl-CoA epimerase